jgi:LPS O-antigen subunit length determinant protein (WzzB/FepE family)
LATKFELVSQIDDLHLQISSHNIQPTKQIGKIITNENPMKPKKRLIVVVAFVTGLVLSIFLVFFMEFIRSFKDETR